MLLFLCNGYVYLPFGICQLLRGQEICLICLFMDAVPLSHQPLCMFVFWVILFDENESKMAALYYETSVDTCRISQKYNPRTLTNVLLYLFISLVLPYPRTNFTQRVQTCSI